jgi:Type I restriction modification DNA specificity domain
MRVPEGWHEVSVEDLKAPTDNALSTGPFGSDIGSRFFEPYGVPVIRGSNLAFDGSTHLIEDGFVFISEAKAREVRRSVVIRGDLVFTCWGTINQVGLIGPRAEYSRYVISNKQMKFTPDQQKADSLFLFYLFSGPELQRTILDQGIGSSVPGFNLGQLKALRFMVPPLAEQRAIAKALGDVDALLSALDAALAKKRDLKQAAMLKLLTGRTRLPGFHSEWEMKRIGDIATPSTQRNAAGEKLPVLTCSKHSGFLDSLGFFRNQVFSKDLSTYRIIRRGEIGYPANHVEEGSIGLQTQYDVALVSPILRCVYRRGLDRQGLPS